MKKEHTVVMLPTEKASRLVKNAREGKNGLLMFYEHERTVKPSDGFKQQHLYILSPEEVQKGDWAIIRGRFPSRCNNVGPGGIRYFDCSECFGTQETEHMKKIVATTDSDLWFRVYGGQEDKNGELEVPKIGIDFVQRYVKEWNKGNKIDSVMLEYNRVGHEDGDSDNPTQVYYDLKLRSNETVIISPILNPITNEEDILIQLASLLEKAGIRKYTNINGFGYSQVERDIVQLLSPSAPKEESLKDRLFKLANDFAVAKKGDVAVLLHGIHNNL